MCSFRRRINRPMVIAALMAVCCTWAQGSDPKKVGRPFSIELDDGIKTFHLAKKLANELDLLPPPPMALPKTLGASDLAKVPEVGLEATLPKTWSKQEAIEELEFRFATVNHFNLKQTDGFVKALVAQRPDLAGLPFSMGTDCLLPQEKALAFGTAVARTHENEDRLPAIQDGLRQAMVAALMQVHGPREKQLELAKTLATVPHVDATVAMARLALFSRDANARESAAEGLRVRRDQDYTPILLDGMRYPLPDVARRAVEALVRLQRTDVLPQLVAVLEAPDPRLPVQQKAGWAARELVRINHHRNCLLCHAPAQAKTVLRLPEQDNGKVLEREQKAMDALEKRRDDRDSLLAAVPLPNRGFEAGSSAYRGHGDLDRIVVRVDVTYLRQDFSALLPVEDAAPWPEQQRFDFLVRTRALSEADAAALKKRLQPIGDGAISPYQQAALFGLRELTGLEATTPADWRRLLKLSAPQ